MNIFFYLINLAYLFYNGSGFRTLLIVLIFWLVDMSIVDPDTYPVFQTVLDPNQDRTLYTRPTI